jgi:hypothetical protein
MTLTNGKRWFGPRSGGWGWCPVSWEGWTFTLLWLLISASGLVALIARDRPRWTLGWVLAMVGVLAAILIVKGYPHDRLPDADDPRDERP